MFKVDQTCFGGKDAPPADQGNCFQACVATVLQMPLEEAYDCRGPQEKGNHWFDDFCKWLEQYGLGCLFFEHTKEKPVVASAFPGLYIVECQSNTLYQGELHVVVACDGEVIHDPNPHANGRIGDNRGIYIFVPLRPYELVRRS